MDGWVDEWINGWVDGLTDESVIYSVPFSVFDMGSTSILKLENAALRII